LFFSFFFNFIGVCLRFSLRYYNPNNRYPKSDPTNTPIQTIQTTETPIPTETSTPTKLENTQTPSPYLLPTNIQKNTHPTQNQSKD